MRLLTTLLLICSTIFVQAQNIESTDATAAVAVVTENTQQETTVSKSSQNIDIVD